MTIEALKRVLPPPAEPMHQPARSDWVRLTNELGLTYPADFRELCETYGGGTIGHGIALFSPVEHEYASLLEQQTQIVSELRAAGVEPYVDALIFPETGGLLLWAMSDAGDAFYWSTKAPDPDRWPVVLSPRSFPTSVEYPMPMTRFLVALLVGEIPDITSQLTFLGPPFEFFPG